MYQPTQITVVDGGIFLDGGSIRIEAVDGLQVHYSFYLDRCFKLQDSHSTQLFLNQKIIPKASLEESTWLKLLLSADYQSAVGGLVSLTDEPWLENPVDVSDVLTKAESNPEWMMKYLVHQLITHLQSPEYHSTGEEVLIRL